MPTIQSATSSTAVTLGAWPALILVTSTLLPLSRSTSSIMSAWLSRGMAMSPSQTRYETATSLYPAYVSGLVKLVDEWNVSSLVRRSPSSSGISAAIRLAAWAGSVRKIQPCS